MQHSLWVPFGETNDTMTAGADQLTFPVKRGLLLTIVKSYVCLSVNRRRSQVVTRLLIEMPVSLRSNKQITNNWKDNSGRGKGDGISLSSENIKSCIEQRSSLAEYILTQGNISLYLNRDISPGKNNISYIFRHLSKNHNWIENKLIMYSFCLIKHKSGPN